jgi:methylthioribose-1-phosphate isomerase
LAPTGASPSGYWQTKTDINDSVAANGDTANKIGTHQLAILCAHFGVKMIIAAPTTSIDLSIDTGAGIPIEERPGIEVTQIRGRVIDDEGSVKEPFVDRHRKKAAGSASLLDRVVEVVERAVGMDVEETSTDDGEPEDQGAAGGSVETQTVSIAAAGINVWNPAFGAFCVESMAVADPAADVTPANLIHAIVTEKGAIEKKPGEKTFKIKEFLSSK